MNSVSRILVLALALGVIASPAVSDEAADIEAMIAGAAEALAQARQAGNSWTTTEPLIAEASAALAAGELDRAEELAQRARLTADMAQHPGSG